MDPSDFYKKCSPQLSPLLMSGFEESYTSQSQPPTMRQAVISLILKKDGGHLDCSSYRPISLLVFSSKFGQTQKLSLFWEGSAIQCFKGHCFNICCLAAFLELPWKCECGLNRLLVYMYVYVWYICIYFLSGYCFQMFLMWWKKGEKIV